METRTGRGLHNLKNLFNKPKVMDLVIFFIIVMTLFMAWAYYRDINECRKFYEENACRFCNPDRAWVGENLTENDLKNLNISIIFKEGFKSGDE